MTSRRSDARPAAAAPPIPPASPAPSDDAPSSLHEPRLWRDNGWTAQVIKNNDDEGWAVAMYRDRKSVV